MTRQLRFTSAPAIAVLIATGLAVLAGCAHPRSAPVAGGAAPATGESPAADGGPRDSLRPTATHPLSDVTARDIDAQPGSRFEELLVGRVPGLRVVATAGGGLGIRLLGGPTTILGDRDPLYVVDGMPVHVAPGRGLDWLNPRDIARIRVLRDISALSRYGSRAANGVILITTRRGPR